PYAIPAGKTLIQAQLLWKEKKNAGRKIAAVFVSDVSGSMSGLALKNLKLALAEGAKFIDPANAIGLVEHNDTVRRILPISDFNALQQSRFLAAVKQMSAGGDTAMFDGIITGLQMLQEFTSRNPDYRGVIFVLSDGDTNAGKFQSIEDIGSVADALNIPIYTIAYGENAKTGLLGQLASINEAATMSAKDEAIVSKIGALLNLEM
ncbi:MAG: VWA domain-containing protein, partial [Spirochaetaceae bacterium]